MKVIGTIAVQSLSGRNGAAKHNQNNTAGRFKRPSNPRSSAQSKVRALFTTNTKAWGNLTDAQRNAWIALGSGLKATDRIGNKHVIKGKQTYSRVNNNLLGAGSAAVSAAPSDQTVIAPTAASFNTNTSSVQTLTFAATPVPASTAYIFKATKPLSAGYSTPPKSAFRVVKYIPAATATGYNSFADYTAIFGTPVTGKKIFGQLIAINLTNGAKSAPISFVGTTA